MPKGQEYPVRYHGMIVSRFIDSFVPEQSAVHQVMEGSDFFYANSPTKKGYGDLTVLKSVVARAHLWCDRRLKRPAVHFSDELQVEIARRSSRIPKHHQLKTLREAVHDVKMTNDFQLNECRTV